MEFENGLKLLVEMADANKYDYTKLPPQEPEPELELSVQEEEPPVE